MKEHVTWGCKLREAVRQSMASISADAADTGHRHRPCLPGTRYFFPVKLTEMSLCDFQSAQSESNLNCLILSNKCCQSYHNKRVWIPSVYTCLGILILYLCRSIILLVTTNFPNENLSRPLPIKSRYASICIWNEYNKMLTIVKYQNWKRNLFF